MWRTWGPDSLVIQGAGYNHKPKGFECDGSETCKSTCSVEAVHAEQSCLLSPRGFGPVDSMLHVKVQMDNGFARIVPSGPPSCPHCSKLILDAGIQWMWLYHADGWTRYDTVAFHAASILNNKHQPDQAQKLMEAWWNQNPEMRIIEVLCGENLRVHVRLHEIPLDESERSEVGRFEAPTLVMAIEGAVNKASEVKK
jgi:deoxycytidylate deaminase